MTKTKAQKDTQKLQTAQIAVTLLPENLRGKISDGYHTFNELYDHRVELYIALCRQLVKDGHHFVWRAVYHSDGSHFEGLFVLGIRERPGDQISYHIPIARWDDCGFATALPKVPNFDGHSSADVLERLRKL